MPAYQVKPFSQNTFAIQKQVNLLRAFGILSLLY